MSKPSKLEFFSLSSGSSGNCYYLGNEFFGILIDAGLSAGAIRKFLKERDISMQKVMGVLVTHNHTDHTKGLEVLTRRDNLPVFTTEKIWNSILTPRTRIARESARKIHLQQTFHLAGFDIEAFPVSHDAPETIGFHISAGEKRITVATDLGHICQVAAPYIKAANLLVIESNYDNEMLRNSRYPHFLKNRIMSDQGHLSNHQTSSFIAENYSDRLSHICLAHLSRNNNTPEIALKTMQQAFSERGIAINGQPQISVLNRFVPSEVIKLI